MESIGDSSFPTDDHMFILNKMNNKWKSNRKRLHRLYARILALCSAVVRHTHTFGPHEATLTHQWIKTATSLFRCKSSPWKTTKLLRVCLTVPAAVKNHVIKYCETTYERVLQGKNLFWLVKNSSDALSCLHMISPYVILRYRTT